MTANIIVSFIEPVRPPNSQVVLDEHQRQTETEKLFHAHLFKLAEEETSAADEKEHRKNLEKRLAKLEKQGVHDRVNASTLMLKVCTGRVDTVDEKLAAVEAQLEKLKTATAVAGVALNAAKPATPEPDPVVATIQQEVDVLFLDRDNILKMVEEANTRLTRLEENLRALTLQRAPPARSQAGLSHRIPITNPNGSQIDLNVPKGMAHVGLKKENAAPRTSTTALKKENGAARSFSPGEDWS